MSDENIDERTSQALLNAVVKDILRDFPKGLVPSPIALVIVGGDISQIGLNFATDEHKRRSMAVLRAALMLGGADAAVLVSEAWMSSDIEGGIRPSEHPKRKEIVVVQAQIVEQAPAFAIFEIIRDEAEQVISLKPVDMGGKGVGGMMHGLFPYNDEDKPADPVTIH